MFKKGLKNNIKNKLMRYSVNINFITFAQYIRAVIELNDKF